MGSIKFSCQCTNLTSSDPEIDIVVVVTNEPASLKRNIDQTSTPGIIKGQKGLSTSGFKEQIWWNYRPADYIFDTPESVRQMRQSQMIIGSITMHAPSKVRRLQSASDAESAFFEGQKARQICVSRTDSNREIFRKLLDSFEAILI